MLTSTDLTPVRTRGRNQILRHQDMFASLVMQSFAAYCVGFVSSLFRMVDFQPRDLLTVIWKAQLFALKNFSATSSKSYIFKILSSGGFSSDGGREDSLFEACCSFHSCVIVDSSRFPLFLERERCLDTREGPWTSL